MPPTDAEIRIADIDVYLCWNEAAMNLMTLLDDPVLSKIVPFEKVAYRNQDIILEEDDTGQDVYFILQGEVQVRSKVAKDDKLSGGLARLKENDFFGELAMFDGEPRSAEVIAMTDCVIARIDGPSLIRFMDESPEKGYFVLREIFMNMVRHLRQNNIRTKTVLQLYLNENAT
jgi:CRP/FNR family transcriptional regulator, cyclic AMP receptor protein